MADTEHNVSSRSSSRESSFSLCYLAESAYAKVIFCEIHDSYSAESDVECLYQLSELIVPHPDDYVGLFRVGWQDFSQCITSVPCSSAICNSSLAGDSYNKIVFKVKDLPKDDLEYYQFLYLTKNHEICGASTPFKFHSVHEDENVVVLSAEHDFLEVKTSASLLRHRLDDTRKYIALLEKAKKELENKVATIEKEREQQENKVATVEKEREQLENKVATVEKEREKLENKVATVEKEREQLDNKVATIEKEREQLENKVATVEKERENAKSLIEKEKFARQEFELQLCFYLSSFIEETKEVPAVPTCSETLQTSLHDLKHFINHLSEDNTSQKLKTEVLRKHLAKVKSDFSAYGAKDVKLMQSTVSAESAEISILKLVRENSQLKEEKCALEKNLSDTKDLFRASEECKNLVHLELENVKKSKNEMASTMEDLKLLNSLLKKQLANNENAIKEMENVWKELEEVKLSFDSEKESWEKHRNNLEQQINDHTASLQESTVLLERKDKQRSESEQKIDNLTVCLQEATVLLEQKDKQCIELEQQTDNLTARLKEAAILREQRDKQRIELEQQIDDLTVRLKEAAILQKQRDKQRIELEKQIDGLTIRLKDAAELYKKQFLEIRTLKKALKSSESSRKKRSSDGAVGFTGESAGLSSSDSIISLEGTRTPSLSSVQSTDSNKSEQNVKVENKELQSPPGSRPANLTGSYIAWSGCSSFADVTVGRTSAPVEEDSSFCGMAASSVNEMDSSLHLLMATASKNPNETVFVRSGIDYPSSTTISSSEALQGQDNFPSNVDPYVEPTSSLYHDSPEVFDLPCPLCEKIIAVHSNNTTAMDDHLLNVHRQQLCPVCGRMFDKGLPSNYFKYHVENHFISTCSRNQ